MIIIEKQKIPTANTCFILRQQLDRLELNTA